VLLEILGKLLLPESLGQLLLESLGQLLLPVLFVGDSLLPRVPFL